MNTRLRILVLAAVIASTAASGTAWAVTHQTVIQTPCEAAETTIVHIRAKAAEGNGFAVAAVGGSYGTIFRGLSEGQFEDVEGPVSEDLRDMLVVVAGDFDVMGAVGGLPTPDELTVGETSAHMDSVLALCGVYAGAL